MRVRGLFGVPVAVLLLGACATGSVVVQNTERITEPKVIGLDAPFTPWVAQIETRIRQRGFRVKRLSRESSGALTSTDARFVLVLRGSYYEGWEHRCFGGGYKFQSLTAELIDLAVNESVVSVSGEGYSEGCPPAVGTIFEDVATAIAARWE